MRGLFGGDLEDLDGTSLERAAPEIVQVLRGAAPRDPLPELPGPPEGSPAGLEIVLFDVTDDGAVRFSGDLSAAPPLGALVPQRAAALEALARVASALGVLHAADTCHGDLGLGGDAIRVRGEGGRVALLVPARRPPAGALLGARLRAGAPPAVAAFSAPEVVTGYEATPASDVYALAALAHEIVTGRAPLGQIDFAEARQGPFSRLAPVLERALAASPLARPSADALAAALLEAAAVARDLEQPAQAGPYRGAPAAKAPTPRARSAAEASARKQQASSMSGILLVLLAVGGLFVFTGAVWLVSVTWTALDGPGRFVLLLVLTSGILGAGVALGRKGYAGSGRALVVLGVELLWANGAYLLAVSGKLGDPGAWAVLAAAMTALAFVLAGALDSLVFAVLAALHYTLFAATLGAALHGGAPTGPSMFTLAIGMAGAAIAFAGHRWRRERVGVPFAVLAALAAFSSALAGVALLSKSEHALYGSAWPYAVAAIAALFALALRGPYASFAAVAAGAILTVVPTIEALMRHDDLAYLLAAVGIGFGVLGAALGGTRLGRDPGAQAAWVLVGLVSAVTGTSILFLVKCWDEDGFAVLSQGSGVYLALVIAVSAALVGASYALGRRAQRKTTYRLIELAGLLQIFGTFTLQSLVRYKDAFYPLVILAVGAACLAVGATTKRATLVLTASSALLLNLSIQYFAKLWDVFPASALALVFGIALLAGGVFYERRLKHLLPGLRAWG